MIHVKRLGHATFEPPDLERILDYAFCALADTAKHRRISWLRLWEDRDPGDSCECAKYIIPSTIHSKRRVRCAQ